MSVLVCPSLLLNVLQVLARCRHLVYSVPLARSLSLFRASLAASSLSFTLLPFNSFTYDPSHFVTHSFRPRVYRHRRPLLLSHSIFSSPLLYFYQVQTLLGERHITQPTYSSPKMRKAMFESSSRKSRRKDTSTLEHHPSSPQPSSGRRRKLERSGSSWTTDNSTNTACGTMTQW